MRYIVFDTETQNTFDEVESNDPAALSLSVLCAYDSLTQTYTSYLENELGKFWPLVEQSDMLVSYNGDHFDIPLLNKYYQGDLTKIKSLDMLKEIRNSLGRRIKLDDIALATLGKNKTAHGLEAVKWWKSGEIDKIIKYCLEDVKITKEVFDYAILNNHLKYKDGNDLKEILLDTKKWMRKENSVVTYSLPF